MPDKKKELVQLIGKYLKAKGQFMGDPDITRLVLLLQKRGYLKGDDEIPQQVGVWRGR